MKKPTAEYENNCAAALAACARVCCICRRFRPSHLQVHHIIERSKGGSDSFDNLIPACIFCHQGHIHARVPFTQRFSESELKQIRDFVYTQIREGKLVPRDLDADTSIPHADILDINDGSLLRNNGITISRGRFENPGLPREAGALVIAIAASPHGILLATQSSSGASFSDGAGSQYAAIDTNRSFALYQSIVEALVNVGILKQENEEIFRLTHRGFQCADALSSNETLH